MEGLRAYVLAVSAGAVLCSILLSLTETGAAGKGIQRMICGLVMTILALQPLSGGFTWNLADYSRELEQQIHAVMDQGAEQYRAQLASRISEQTCAYIQKKAESLGLALQVSVILSHGDLPVPDRVILEGDASPAARNTLKTYISQELGIQEEDQYWN